MAIQNNYQFLQASSPYGQYSQYGQQGVGQSQGQRVQPYQNGVPNTTPQIFGMPTSEQLEAALNFQENLGATQSVGAANPFSRTQGVKDPRGLAFEGFVTPQSTGTGELSPVVEGREDSLGILKDYYC